MNGQDRLAGASEIPAERLGEGGPLDVYVAENPAFRLPEEGDTPLILIGAGTGVAPFRAFLQQRADRFLEPQYELMLRARLPGGICTTEQWLAIDGIGRELGNGTIRLTARQTFQFHGVLKRDIKPLIQRINQVLIDSIGGCGDVNRNVLCNPNPVESALHAQVHGWAQRLSEHLLPRSRAYHEIWLDEEPVASGEPESEPLYGET